MTKAILDGRPSGLYTNNLLRMDSTDRFNDEVTAAPYLPLSCCKEFILVGSVILTLYRVDQ